MKFKSQKPIKIGGNHIPTYKHQVQFTTFAGKMSSWHEREVVYARDSVGAIIYDSTKEQFGLIEQFRCGIAFNEAHLAWPLEIVAGNLEKGEKPDETVVREIKEEAGVEAQKIEAIGSFYLCPGYSTEKMFVYLAQVNFNENPSRQGGLAQEYEDIRLHTFKAQQWREVLTKITAFPTFATLLWFGNWYEDQSH